jgi:DNA-binding CsgD family transcriptional regulator
MANESDRADRPAEEANLARQSMDDLIDAELESLLRELVRAVAARAAAPLTELSVVLELEVDALRCVMLVENAESATGALSPREQEIARMVGAGYPNKTIAARLGISSWTVSTHLRRMFAKLGVNSRAALVAKVLEEELVFDERRVFPRRSS